MNKQYAINQEANAGANTCRMAEGYERFQKHTSRVYRELFDEKVEPSRTENTKPRVSSVVVATSSKSLR